jgi:hypothetical protein
MKTRNAIELQEFKLLITIQSNFLVCFFFGMITSAFELITFKFMVEQADKAEREHTIWSETRSE